MKTDDLYHTVIGVTRVTESMLARVLRGWRRYQHRPRGQHQVCRSRPVPGAFARAR
ncbi:hypothetical protein [Plantactinospora sp. DSM 117369]